MQLCYVYIFDYKNLKNIGINFNSKYHFNYDDNKSELQISKNLEFLDTFWGVNIQSLTAIIGNNGAGKTNILRFILSAVVNGSGEHNPNGILVYIDDNSQIKYYSNKVIDIENKIGVVKLSKIDRPHSIETINYSSHFNPLSSFGDLFTSELSGMSNITDGWLLTHDLENYSNLNSNSGAYNMRDYITAYNSQNQLRIALFIQQYYHSEICNSIKIPRYILLTPNKSGYRVLEINKYFDSVKLPTFDINRIRDYKERKLIEIVYYSILNYINEGNSDEWIQFLNSFVDLFNKNTDDNITVYEMLKYIQKDCNVNDQFNLNNLKLIIENIDSFFEFNENTQMFFIDISTRDGFNNFSAFVDKSYKPNSFLTGRYFDLACTHSLDGYSTLSSGEQIMLNFLSRLYYYQTINPEKFSNAYDSQLIILDEAEIGLHPEWQRKFISIITSYLNNRKADHKYQIILTSHSPIILSDIPKQCVNFIEINKKGQTSNVSDSQCETFATNVFELYKNSFFLRDGLIGEFAKSKIEYIINQLDSNISNKYKYIRDLISIIGDKYVQNFLISKLDNLDKTKAIEILSKRIEELKGMQKNEQN